ncbi:MAG: hypothetical protein D6714_04825 [Bacteroidetes bacterium]|nr:MAG: hypothetical protein D6714_04825 [Bacteroidota bacterium]
MKIKWFIFSGFAFSLLLSACQSDKGKQIPDVSTIPMDIEIRRFDVDFFSMDTLRLESELAALQAKYPVFSSIFFDQILGSTDPRIAPEGHLNYVRGFLTHLGTRKLFDTTQVVFPQPVMDELKSEFDETFRFFKYYFPNEQVPPHITTFISEYTIAAFVYQDNALAVGLDFFLGAQHPYTEYNPGNPYFSQYLVRTFNKDHLVLKTIKPLIKDMMGTAGGNRFLDYMIHNGKELYILSQLMPYAPDTVITEYSAAQLDWVEKNEKEIWYHFLREDLTYSTDIHKFKKLIDYSPNAPGMPKEAPGRTANWIGWQIVKAYMKRHPETSLDSLIALKDAQVILDKSRYKPDR